MRQSYSHTHRLLRAQWKRRIESGEVIFCARCGEVILPCWPAADGREVHRAHVLDCRKPQCEGACWARWELGHVDGGGPSEWSGPEHFACNRTAGGREGARITNTKKARQGLVDPHKVLPMIRREW